MKYILHRDTKQDSDPVQEDKWAVKVMDDLSIREKDFMKRMEWNVNEEISEQISKVADAYNL